jgi:parallel beta-helix repeat protein
MLIRALGTAAMLQALASTTFAAPLACPAASTGQLGPVYYVALNEPGSSNSRCDGRSPSDQGHGHCPFKDFTSANTFQLLRGVAGVRVEVRTGIYTFATEGLSISGTGTDDAHRTVLTAYQDEDVVFDGRFSLQQVLRVSGRYTAVERVTIRSGGGHNMRVDGSNGLVQCNRFLRNGSSDSLKGVDSAGPVSILDNEFTGWDSQAIDLTNVHNWMVARNYIHDGAGNRAGAVGMKFETSDVSVRDNAIVNSYGINMGGVSSVHHGDYEALNVTVERNTFTNVPGGFVRFYSCANCSVRNNTVFSAGGGMLALGDIVDGPSGCHDGLGCLPSAGLTVTGNALHNLSGSPANTFWGIYSREAVGLVSGGNTYCTAPGQPARFYYDGGTRAIHELTFPEWVIAMGTDSTSWVGTCQ